MIPVFFCLVLLLQSQAGQPASWLRDWLAALHRSSSMHVHVLVMSDSTARVDQTNGIGYGPDERANLWPERLRTALQQQVSVEAHGTGLLTLEGNAHRFDTDLWSVSGSYEYNPSIGPWEPELDHGQVPSNGSTVLLRPGVVASLSPQSGDTLWIYWASCPDSHPFNVTIDGKSQGLFGNETSLACTARRTRVYSGLLGKHSLTITPISGNSYVYAAEWTAGNGGIEVDNLAIGGATSTFYAGPEKLAYIRVIPHVTLAIVALGINDFIHAVRPAYYNTNLLVIIEQIRRLAPGAAILIVNQYRVFSDSRRNPLGLLQSDYMAIAKRVAHDQKIGYVDIAEAWGPFAVADAHHLLTRDAVHPSDLGGRAFSCELERVLLQSHSDSCVQFTGL